MEHALFSEWFSYDPETGIVVWSKVPAIGRNANQLGMPVGSMSAGYLRVKLHDRSYLVHIIAWVLMTGSRPIGRIDHRDTVKTNNRWKNLRDVGHVINGQNVIRARSDSATGLRGVTRYGDKFGARITIEAGRVFLGVFDTPAEASAAYIDAKRAHHSAPVLSSL